MNLEFFNDISLKEAVVKTRGTVNTEPIEGAHLRLFKDGRTFPAEQLVKDHNLEYVDKGAVTGNGFDIIDSKESPHYPQENPRVVMVALASKSLPKVDLFGSVGYNKDNTPKTSVISQGSVTTGKWLIELLEEVYDETLFTDNNYVDLVINTQFSVTTPNNIYQMPKKVARGANKGETSYQRRTDTELWPLTIWETPVEKQETLLPDLQDMVDPTEEDTKKITKKTSKVTSTV